MNTSIYYIAGILCGIVVGLAVLLVSRKKGAKKQYDERQMLGRGKAFQAGFFTLLISVSVVNLCGYAGILPGSAFFWQVGAIIFSVAVFALTAIHLDAYVSMTDSPKRILFSGTVLFLCLVSMAFVNLHSSHEPNHDFAYIDLMLAAVWGLILLALLGKQRRKAEDEE